MVRVEHSALASCQHADVTVTVSAAVLRAPRRIDRDAFATPVIGDDDALLQVEACGLCGTDHEQWSGDLFGAPIIPGHETVGVIAEIGAAAAQRWNVDVGDRVAVEVFQSCGRCAACATGEYRRCERHGLRDSYGFVPVERAPHLWGGYAEHQYLAPDSLLLPVPPRLDAATATLFNPLGAGVRWAVTVPGTKPGDVVVVLGPGVRGLSCAAAARDAGAAFVAITGLGSRDGERLALAREFGADLAIDVERDDPVRALRDAVGRLADVVVDVTAKAPAALGQAVALARPGGSIVVAGVKGSNDTPGFAPDQLVAKELRVLGAFGVDTPAYEAALELLASGRYPFAELPRRTASFDDISDLLASMAGEGAPPPVHGVFAPH
jgi:alcohol dehydrogenase